MGTWGHGAFDNDHASDWLQAIEDGRRLDWSVLSGRDSERNEIRAIAAAELIATAIGTPGVAVPERVLQLATSIDVRDEIVMTALDAVRTIRSSSELRSLWDEAGELQEWLDALKDLETRLSADRRCNPKPRDS
jgi:hypothetical protein